MTKAELWHSDYPGHALNSTFRDTNCTVCFQINPHWISTKDIPKRPGGWKTDEGSPVSHKSVVARAAVRECGFERGDHLPYSPNLAPSDYFLFPQLEKTLGKQYWTDDEVISAVEDFFEGHDNESNRRCDTDGRSVWTAGGRLLLKINHMLVRFDRCIIIVSL